MQYLIYDHSVWLLILSSYRLSSQPLIAQLFLFPLLGTIFNLHVLRTEHASAVDHSLAGEKENIKTFYHQLKLRIDITLLLDCVTSS